MAELPHGHIELFGLLEVHLVVSFPHRRHPKTIIVELPHGLHPHAGPTSRRRMAAARAALIRACGQPGNQRFALLTGTATLTGVAFFDVLRPARRRPQRHRTASPQLSRDQPLHHSLNTSCDGLAGAGPRRLLPSRGGCARWRRREDRACDSALGDSQAAGLPLRPDGLGLRRGAASGLGRGGRRR